MKIECGFDADQRRFNMIGYDLLMAGYICVNHNNLQESVSNRPPILNL